MLASPAPAPAATSQSAPASKPMPSGRPAWQRNPLFRFFSSVKLAVVLLSVIIVACAVGTVYESNFDAKVARYYVYEAPWFNIWLLLLCSNLACAALSRRPWKRHHTGFLVTHLGVIVLLFGALIGRIWGIEGTMTIFKGQSPNSQLLVDQNVLRIEENGSRLEPLPVSIIGRQPTAKKPWVLGYTPAGWKIELTEYAPLLAAEFDPQPAEVPGGKPAVRVRLESKRLKQTIDKWLLADDAENNTLDMGLAAVKLQRGAAPTASTPAPAAANGAPNAATPSPTAVSVAPNTVDESIVAFALKPNEQVAQPAPNTVSSGLKIRLEADATKRKVFVDWRGATWDFDFEAERGKEQDLSGSGLSVLIDNYWPDFVLKDGQPATASAEPNNPAVLVRVRGKLPGASADDANPAAALVNATSPDASPDGPDNQVTIFCDDAGALTFLLKSSASPEPVRGNLALKQAINTGWADWQLQIDKLIPNAVSQTSFRPLPPKGPGGGSGSGEGPGMGGGNHSEGVRVRLSRNGESHEEWAAAGWNVTMPTKGQVTQISYGFRVKQLPIGLQLTDFHVDRDEGTDSPAGFKSTIKLTDIHGQTDSGSCSMNQPYNYPGHWVNTFSGLTYKMSQASWNPQNLGQSTIQILRDPGWFFKWTGSLLVCIGIFTLFYLRPLPRLAAPVPSRPVRPAQSSPPAAAVSTVSTPAPSVATASTAPTSGTSSPPAKPNRKGKKGRSR
jgi:hypothetical protein